MLRGGTVFCIALAACSSSPGKGAPQPAADAGTPAYDAPACGPGDAVCEGVCVQQDVTRCGASCVACPQPAASHGTADCFDGQCTHVCEGGYVACGASGCCGIETVGDVQSVAVGGDMSCGLTSVGQVFCWGDGTYGALGDGVLSALSSTPVVVQSVGAVTQMAVGDHHVCVATLGGAVSCWGDDEDGQLGDGDRTPKPTAVTPAALSSGVAGVAAGSRFSCAALTSGGAMCWGDDSYGQLGDGASQGGSLLPVKVVGLSDATQIAAGVAFACAVTSTGGVSCWGDGAQGQLGGPAVSDKPIPVALPAAAKSIALGGRHACALFGDGRVFCWGANDANQLGIGAGPARPAPGAVSGVSGVAAIAAGGDETCALDQAGAVTCWGVDPVGDVGAGPAGPAVIPSLESGVAILSVVGGHGCAVTSGGAAKCWGSNQTGDLGDGTTIDSWVPVDVRGL